MSIKTINQEQLLSFVQEVKNLLSHSLVGTRKLRVAEVFNHFYDFEIDLLKGVAVDPGSFDYRVTWLTLFLKAVELGEFVLEPDKSTPVVRSLVRNVISGSVKDKADGILNNYYEVGFFVNESNVWELRVLLPTSSLQSAGCV